MVLLGVNTWLSVIGALAFGFATNNLVLYEAGHLTKLQAISYLPLVASGMLLAFRKIYTRRTFVRNRFRLDLGANHIQMTYYFFLTVLIWGIAELVKNLREGNLVHFGKSRWRADYRWFIGSRQCGIQPYGDVEYAQDTMRGKPILEKSAAADAGSSSAVEGLAWDYAMQWSNNTLDLFASYIPGMSRVEVRPSLLQTIPLLAKHSTNWVHACHRSSMLLFTGAGCLSPVALFISVLLWCFFSSWGWY
ncbi:MAG: hypothetical protein R2795_16500 [Saprospiraceae bacterium]